MKYCMKPFFAIFFMYAVSVAQVANAQPLVDKVKFFSDTSVIHATLNTNFGKLLRQKYKEGTIFPASFTCKLGDSMAIHDQMAVEVRGHFRRDYCYLPPLKLLFNAVPGATLNPLKGLKLVSACRPVGMYEQYLLKEYLIYKIYNLITDKSFRVRLLDLSYQDSSGSKKTITEHAFLLEDAKEVAKRNDCKEWKKARLPTESTDRRQMTIVAIFEYMIGNTDWSVSNEHNIKLIVSKKDTLSNPYVVPYDFDFSGLVSTNYSAPNEQLNIETVQQRLYRGFPRNIGEINEVLDIFRQKKDAIYSTITNFNLLAQYSKKQMTDYLDGFFDFINDPSQVKDVFITNARTE